jgi:hypothetical protein
VTSASPSRLPSGRAAGGGKKKGHRRDAPFRLPAILSIACSGDSARNEVCSVSSFGEPGETLADLPTRTALMEALAAAGAFHDEYERVVLKGVVDERWSGFCAAYLLGRLGDFAAASRLAELLGEIGEAEDWAAITADHVLAKLRS